MVKFQERADAANTLAYYLGDKGLSEEERAGVWLGAGCQRSGVPLGAGVTAPVMKDVLHGYSPRGDRLFANESHRRRSCWDCTVTTEKSVSIAALCSQTEAAPLTVAAFSEALVNFVPHLESLAYRQDNGRPFIPTGNLIVARFVHQASRHADPHLHAHLCLMNATQGPKDYQWRSLETLPLYKQQSALKAVFNALLLRALIARGLAAYMDPKDGLAKLPVPKPICRKFSKAHNAIVAMAEELEKGPLPADWDKLPKAALVNRLNERTRPRHRPEKPNWQTLLDPDEQKAVDHSLRIDPARIIEQPPILPVESPVALLRRKLASISLFHHPKTVRQAVQTVAAAHPEIPLGHFTRASETITAKASRQSRRGAKALDGLRNLWKKVSGAATLIARRHAFRQGEIRK